MQKEQTPENESENAVLEPMHEHAKEKGPFLTMPVAVIIAGALIAGSIFAIGLRGPSGGANTAAMANTQQPPVQAADITKVKTGNDPFMGNPNAPVTIAYWYDYQCPFCQKAEEESMPQLV